MKELTLTECTALRIAAEARIAFVLNKLQRQTGLDLAAVNVNLIVRADDTGEPRRFCHAVRIDLAV